VDWLRIADPRSRALSVSRKDRGAILPMGRAKQQVFWYGGPGRFTTSTYYADTLPDWVKRVNARDFGRRYAGRAWTPLLPASAYPEPDSVPVENGGRDYVFPHALPADPAQAARALPATPWMDDVTLEAALAGADAMGLGRGPQTDVLAVSLSTTDAVGHQYGMDSRELHDQILRLDRSLGAFIDSLYKTRDSTRVVFALTGDHGMAPYPELHFAGADPARGRADVGAVLRAHNARLAARGVRAAFDMESGAITGDTAAVRAAGLDPRAALAALAADLRRTRNVRYVMLRDELPALAAQRRDTLAAKYARRWLHMLPADNPVVAAVTLEPYAYLSGVNYATHGSPHDYDSNVPVLFAGGPFRPGRYGQFARVVDMAPHARRRARRAPAGAARTGWCCARRCGARRRPPRGGVRRPWGRAARPRARWGSTGSARRSTPWPTAPTARSTCAPTCPRAPRRWGAPRRGCASGRRPARARCSWSPARRAERGRRERGAPGGAGAARRPVAAPRGGVLPRAHGRLVRRGAAAVREVHAARRSAPPPPPPPADPRTLAALGTETRDLLRTLAVTHMQALGAHSPTRAMVEAEMLAWFERLAPAALAAAGVAGGEVRDRGGRVRSGARAVPGDAAREAALRRGARRALEELGA
jgi:hypothetical protein